MNTQISRRTTLSLLRGAGICGVATLCRPSSAEDGCNSSSARNAWVAESLQRMLAVKPGMGRDQLMHAFAAEGGISTAERRTFVSRDCPYFKVDVTFRRAFDSTVAGFVKGDAAVELKSDVITSISCPYLQLAIED